MIKQFSTAAFVSVMLCGTAVADTVSYVLLNQKGVDQFFMIYNPGTKNDWASKHGPTHMFWVPRCSVVVVTNSSWVHAGSDAAVYTALPVGGKAVNVSNRSSSSKFKIGSDIKGTVKRGGAKATASANISYAQTHATSDSNTIVYDGQVYPSQTVYDVNYYWVAENHATTEFAKDSGFNNRKWGYVLYSSTDQSQFGCNTVYSFGKAYNFQKNFRQYQ